MLGTPVSQDRDVLSTASTPDLGIEAKEMPQAIVSETAPDYLIGSLDTVQPESRLLIASVSDLEKGQIHWKPTDGVTGRLVRHAIATGTTTEVTLPLKGTVAATCPDAHANLCLVEISSWLQPPMVYEIDAATGEVRKSVFTNEVRYPELADLEAEEVDVPGHDGTMIPLSIIHRKDIKLDGSSPCILG